MQEIFQAAVGNYCTAAGHHQPPLVLVGPDHWQHRLPAWPLLEALGRECAMASHARLVTTVEEAGAVVTSRARAPGSV